MSASNDSETISLNMEIIETFVFFNSSLGMVEQIITANKL